MKTLVLAEKPSVGKDIGRVLNCKKGGAFLEGDKYVVTWALGHLVTLADPEKYHEKYKNWDINHLPILPEKLELVVIKQTAKQYSLVKELLNRKDIQEIIIATDAGREGELVARWILEKARCHKPVKRLWISSVTDKAIREGFAHLRDGRAYVNLYRSAQARAEADWLVGINATRCLTTKFNSQLSCGRVQTPTLALIAQREQEIRSFKPQAYYGLSAVGDKVTFRWTGKEGGRTFDKTHIDGLYGKLKGERAAVVAEVAKQRKKTYPPRLYDLTELQRDAARLFSFSPKETLSVMQRLYEQHKALTYPRTDSRYLSSDIVATLPERIKAVAVGPYAKAARGLLTKPIKGSPHFVDDKQVRDHHAIIPTEEGVILQELNANERKIYDLVVTRFLSVFYPPFEYEQTRITVKIGGESFTAQGKIVIAEGYRQITSLDEEGEEKEGEEKEKEQLLPKLNKGDKVPLFSLSITEGKTKPPAPFTEASLLSAMEQPAKYMKLELKLAKTLGETGGLGTVATRADIIEKLYDTFYIEKRGKDIYTTAKGRQLLKLAPTDLRSPALTAQWEQKLAGIAGGQLKQESFLQEIRGYTQKIIQEIKASTAAYIHDNITHTRCEVCGKFMLEVNGKKGKMLVCSDRACNNRKSLSLNMNSRCPQCHKGLTMVGEGEGKRIVCVCGFQEKYETFKKRKEAEHNVPKKAELQKIMSQLNKTEKNNPLANALKDFKFD